MLLNYYIKQINLGQHCHEEGTLNFTWFWITSLMPKGLFDLRHMGKFQEKNFAFPFWQQGFWNMILFANQFQTTCWLVDNGQDLAELIIWMEVLDIITHWNVAYYQKNVDDLVICWLKNCNSIDFNQTYCPIEKNAIPIGNHKCNQSLTVKFMVFITRFSRSLIGLFSHHL